MASEVLEAPASAIFSPARGRAQEVVASVIHLTPMADLDHQHAKNAVLDVADDPIVADAVRIEQRNARLAVSG